MLRVPLRYNPLHVQGSGPRHTALWELGIGAQGTGVNTSAVATLLAVNNTLSFVFGTGVSYLLPASMTL